jgi:hypothetical protein
MKKIRLFWWNEKIFHHQPAENYGDLIGPYLVEKIAQQPVEWTNPKHFHISDWFSPIYVTVGSIIAHANNKCIVWGAGIIEKRQQVPKAKKYLAVRGPHTHKQLVRLGYKVPEVYGDPALLLPKYLIPDVSKQYPIGIVPHLVDYSYCIDTYARQEGIKIISLRTNNVIFTTNEICTCNLIISSSLHGIIVAHAYGIPAVWVKFTGKLYGDDIKFYDYFASVGIEKQIQPVLLSEYHQDQLPNDIGDFATLPQQEKIVQIQNALIEACPFTKQNE